MMPPEQIAELQSLGIAVTAGDAPAVVLARLQARIVRLVTTPPEYFDRPAYERLMQLWATLKPQTEDAADAL
jgi:hypothetical protein